MTGLGAPHWNAEARGIISGLTRGATSAHLARATLEGIALQIHDLVEAMNEDRNAALHTFKVDGGAAANNLLMQMQSDLLSVPVVRPKTVETTALGAAMLAGLAVGFWDSLDQIKQSWVEDRRFVPQIDEEKKRGLLMSWNTAVGKA